MHSFKLKNRVALMGLLVCIFWTGRMLAVILPLNSFCQVRTRYVCSTYLVSPSRGA